MNHLLKIDINADVGEGVGNESKIMPYLSSCNIACGAHAGDLATMTEVVRLAKLNKVKIGAHPSFPDKENFGRVVMSISSGDLLNSLNQQINALQSVLNSQNVRLHHVKPHGALYNLAAKDEKIATVILEVIKNISYSVKLYAPYNSVLAKKAKEAAIEVVFEGFADRNYNNDLSLVSRNKKHALLEDKTEVLTHVLTMVKEGKVKAIDGVEVTTIVDTLCVHGDAKNALEILEYMNQELPKNNICIK